MIILASKSPRRKELLTSMGYKYEVMVSDAPEVTTKENPSEVVEEISNIKASDILLNLDLSSAEYKDSLIIAADTLVFLDKERLGKPKDYDDAVNMLMRLSGRTHHVMTGVTLIKIVSGQVTERVSFHEDTEVSFAPISREDIEAYVKTGDPMDKAGAYAIQGGFAKHIDRINGEYNNVVGLPIARLYKEMKKLGY